MPDKIILKKNQNTREYFFDEGCYITEFWNENTDPEVSIARARLRPGEITRKHELVATTERYLILEGEGTVYIGSASGQQVRQHDVVLIPPVTSQYIQNTGNTDLVFLAICSPGFTRENYRDLE